MARGRIAKFMNNMDEVIPKILGQLDRATSEEYLPPMVVWSGAEVEGENMFRIDPNALPSYGLHWRDRPLEDSYRQRRFAHGLLTIALAIQKVPQARSVMDFWFNMRDILIENLTSIRRFKQPLGIVSLNINSSSSLDQESDEIHVLSYSMQFDIVLS